MKIRKSTKRILYLVISIIFIIGLISGCGSSGNKGESTAVTTTQEASQQQSTELQSTETTGIPELALPIVNDGSVTLTIGTFDNWYAPASYTQNLPIFQEIEKKTGVKVKWDVVPPSQYWTAMPTRIAAGGDDLPDIIFLPEDPVKLGISGVIIPMEELIDKYAPNIKRLFEKYPDVKALGEAPDGHTYKLSAVVTGSTYANPWCLTVRKDWLDKLGLNLPETIDDWYTMMKAIKEKDPNGNGKADEIAFEAVGVYYLDYFAYSWGLHSFYSGYIYPDASGKMQAEYTSPRYKEYLTWLNKIYTEGLLDPEFASVDNEKLTAKINRNIVGAFGTFISNNPSFNSNLKKGGFGDANLVSLLPPKGPYGDQFMEGYGPISGDTGITKACKNPEVAIKWLDYVYASPEGNDFCMYGIEGKSYTREGGEIKLTDYTMKNPDGLGPFEVLRSLGAWPNIPYEQTEEAYTKILLDNYPELKELANKCKPFIKLGIPPILATKEESEQTTAILADLTTYKDEMVLKFIIGKESLDNFDKYVQTLKDMGVDKLLEIKQGQWDRYQKAME